MTVQSLKREFTFPADIKDTVAGSSFHQTLLESTNAIPWQIDWASATFTYIGPQIEALLGWEQHSWKTVNDWAERMHPDDRDRAVNFCISQSQSGIDHEVDYRALTKDNRYVWIRDVVHVLRDANGDVHSLVGFMFDVSEHKATEQKLVDLQRELEALSFEDGLTGIANRRKFDMAIETAWHEACGDGTPLSLILCDIDHFKQFNDRYGHIAGDTCLKQVAHAIAAQTGRPGELTARFGGEEFVVLLPRTDAEAALAMATRIRHAIADLAISDTATGNRACVTLSLGVGTMAATPAEDALTFVKYVDELLYTAKQNGRNRIEAARFC